MATNANDSGGRRLFLIIIGVVLTLGFAGATAADLLEQRLVWGALAIAAGIFTAVTVAQLNVRVVLRLALATFFEARRRRFLNVILIFAIILIGLSHLFATLSPSSQLTMLLDIGLGSIRLCAMLIAVFLGARLIADEVDKRTVDVLLAKPVRRSEFVIGKFLGGWITIFACILLMGAAFMLVYFWKADDLSKQAIATGQVLNMSETTVNCVKATALMMFEMMVLSSIAIAVSTLASWIFSAVFSFTAYFAGQMASHFQGVAEMKDPHLDEVVTPGMRVFSWAMYKVLPHFEQFDIREKMLTHTTVYWDFMGMSIGHAILYSLVMVGLACVFFSYREF